MESQQPSTAYPFPKRIHSGDDSLSCPSKTVDPDRAAADCVYCHPAIVIQGSACANYLSGHRLWLFQAKSVLHHEKSYQIKTMSLIPNMSKAETPNEKDALREFKTKARSFLARLDYLQAHVVNDEIQMWYLPASLKDDLTLLDLMITNGFTSGMERTMISRILMKLLETENRTVMNCGGSKCCTSNKETRIITFHYKTSRVEGRSDSISSSTDINPEKSDPIPSGTSPRIANLKTTSKNAQQEVIQEGRETRRFLPDVVVNTLVENTIHDSLVVEVKKGMKLTQAHETQLKYELLPSAVCQGAALGLLICAGEAVLMKYTKVEENILRCERDHYRFRENCLLEDFVDMLGDLHYNLENLNYQSHSTN